MRGSLVPRLGSGLGTRLSERFMREIETCIMESGDLLFLVQVNAILSLEYVDLLLLQFLVHLLISLQVILNRAVQSDRTI